MLKILGEQKKKSKGNQKNNDLPSREYQHRGKNYKKETNTKCGVKKT